MGSNVLSPNEPRAGESLENFQESFLHLLTSPTHHHELAELCRRPVDLDEHDQERGNRVRVRGASGAGAGGHGDGEAGRVPHLRRLLTAATSSTSTTTTSSTNCVQLPLLVALLTDSLTSYLQLQGSRSLPLPPSQ